MGDFTNLHFSCELKPDTPSDVIEALQYMAGLSKVYAVPRGDLNNLARWQTFLQGDSYYTYAAPVAKLTQEKRGQNPYNEQSEWFFTVVCSFKNYDDVLEAFFDWLSPYVAVHSNSFMLGYILKPEQGNHPIGIYKWGPDKPITFEPLAVFNGNTWQIAK